MADTGPSRRDFPDKLYYRIGEVTGITELPAYVLRFWEAEFPEITPKRTEAGQRLYRKSDIEKILLIKHLLYEKKYTIEGARQHLQRNRRNKNRPAAETLLEQIREELREIRDLLSE